MKDVNLKTGFGSADRKLQGQVPLQVLDQVYVSIEFRVWNRSFGQVSRPVSSLVWDHVKDISQWNM